MRNTMRGRLGLVGALVGCVWGLSTIPARAAGEVTIGGRAEVATPVVGNVPDDLNFDVGLGSGASVNVRVLDFLSVDLRYDALLLYGTIFDHTDTSWVSHSISLGPEIDIRRDPVEVYLGFHPGVYFTQLGASGPLTTRVPATSRTVTVTSDFSTDFGFNTEAGLRWFPGQGFYVGPEIAYHLVYLSSDHLGFEINGTSFKGGKIDDSVGTFTAGLTFGYRF